MISAKSKFARLEGTKVVYDLCGTPVKQDFEDQGSALRFFLFLHFATQEF